MKSYELLLESNKKWAEQQIIENPEFFSDLVHVQSPEYLWIGCSDSRVPPDVITQTKPGEIFIHRNIANMVVHTDLNLLSVLQYAVDVLEVKHIIVCGHHNCGGVKAALGNQSFGTIDAWLRNIKDVYRFNKEELESIENEEDKLNKLIEINVIEQVKNLAKTNIVQRAWRKNNRPHLHGWVYDLRDGIINPVKEIAPDMQFQNQIYRYDNLG